MLELFHVFEVKNGSLAYQHNALVEDLLTAAKEKRGSLALVGGSDAHTYPPVASVFTMAPGATWREFLSSVRAGECLSWGVEMGFTRVLGDVYELLTRDMNGKRILCCQKSEWRDGRQLYSSAVMLHRQTSTRAHLPGAHARRRRFCGREVHH